MKECNQCHKVVRTTDKYCRNCGIKILKPYQLTIINIIKIILIITLIITITMFIISNYI